MSHHDVLKALKEAGLDSLPGAGAEILIDRVRRLISKGKCGAQEWLDIMHEAHKLHITTSATMMFDHVETLQERFEHLVKIRKYKAANRQTQKAFLHLSPGPSRMWILCLPGYAGYTISRLPRNISA